MTFFKNDKIDKIKIIKKHEKFSFFIPKISLTTLIGQTISATRQSAMANDMRK